MPEQYIPPAPGQFVPVEELIAAQKAGDTSHDLAMHNFQVANKYEHQLRQLRATVGKLADQLRAAVPGQDAIPRGMVETWAEQLGNLAATRAND